MPIELVGTTGITTPGMESTAMPTVGGAAVVESGSNTDGEWTRWADGTQICEGATPAVTATIAQGSIYAGAITSNAAFPSAFVSPPTLSLTPQRTSASTGSPFGSGMQEAATATALPTVFVFAALNNISGLAYWIAKGRWK